MAGLDKDTPIPTDIRLNRNSRTLLVTYEDGSAYELSHEYLRVFTPSAEARGHGPGQETLQTGKRSVSIDAIEPIGTYALRFVFSDGHDSGLYSWDLLHDLCVHRDALWEEYVRLLETRGASRDVDTTSRPAAGGGCGHHH